MEAVGRLRNLQLMFCSCRLHVNTAFAHHKVDVRPILHTCIQMFLAPLTALEPIFGLGCLDRALTIPTVQGVMILHYTRARRYEFELHWREK